MLGHVLWWAGYLAAAIWLQKLLPGLDALIPGFIVCLQEKNRQQIGLFMLISVVIQEGAGSFPFGLSILWHGVVASLYFIGVWFFMSGSLLFIVLLSVGIGAGRLLFMLLMDFLRGEALDPQAMFFIFVLQAICTPLLWKLARRSGAGNVGDANQY